MKSFERIALWAVVCLALVVALSAGVGRGASASLPDSGSPKIAVCAVVKIADDLMDSDRFKPARTEFEETLRKDKLNPLEEQGKELETKLRGMPRDDPDFAANRDRFMRLQREYAQTQQEIIQQVEKKVAEQLSEAYGMARASAIAIAEQKGFDFVFASTGAEEELKKDTPLALVRDMLSRPVLKCPKGADITDDVREDLKL
ncbi:MAG TPA: OmpH family outer membrane protein [Phycisphaerales bacterium]|nr:OmpH family outer membrane protein [Phycisphaerales bacterium]